MCALLLCDHADKYVGSPGDLETRQKATRYPRRSCPWLLGDWTTRVLRHHRSKRMWSLCEGGWLWFLRLYAHLYAFARIAHGSEYSSAQFKSILRAHGGDRHDIRYGRNVHSTTRLLARIGRLWDTSGVCGVAMQVFGRCPFDCLQCHCVHYLALQIIYDKQKR